MRKKWMKKETLLWLWTRTKRARKEHTHIHTNAYIHAHAYTHACTDVIILLDVANYFCTVFLLSLLLFVMLILESFSAVLVVAVVAAYLYISYKCLPVLLFSVFFPHSIASLLSFIFCWMCNWKFFLSDCQFPLCNLRLIQIFKFNFMTYVPFLFFRVKLLQLSRCWANWGGGFLGIILLSLC